MGKKNKIFIILIVIIAILLGILLDQFLEDAKPSKNNSISQSQNVNISTSSTPESSKININAASQKELESLPEIGEAKAKKIVQHRPYTSVSQLLNVIGNKAYESIKDKVAI